MSRECYCNLWDTNPDTLVSQGVPRGFCGICERCQAPGHTRHAPPPAPYTGAWCDSCFRKVSLFGNLRMLGIALAIAALAYGCARLAA